MMSFCKTLHTILGFEDHPNLTHCHRNPDGLSLIAGDFQNSANVLPSSSVKPSGKAPEKQSPAVRGVFYDEGFRSCTESLGFESSDEIEIDINNDEPQPSKLTVRDSMVKLKPRFKRSEVRYPPPLTSLTRNGNPSFFLKPVRKDGRFLLTEVKIERPEILRAKREDGRLRLQLVVPRDKVNKVKEEEAAEEKESVRRWEVPTRCHVTNSCIPMWNNTRCVTST